MNLTAEQLAIINSTGNIKINAVAGSGKTTTVIEYAKARPAHSKILYLAFNKSVKLEAVKKFESKGLKNVKVETAHSLAYRHIVFQHNYKVRPQSYKTNEIAELLGLQGSGEKHAEHIVANHINKFIACFCNSDVAKVQNINYLETVSDKKARSFVAANYQYIERQTRLLLQKMNDGEIEIIHDFYLKKFQLSSPKLYYDYILFDEGQDASPAMLDVFFKQDATKVIVGDTHQQIYGWRFAVNSLEKADYKTFYLSTSFRFSQDIANLAMKVLDWKKHLEQENQIKITGLGTNTTVVSKSVVARTNLGLLLKAIAYIHEKQSVSNIYFEGNINSYTYADEGASLYDVLNLWNGKRHLIRDTLIKAMKDVEELEDYINKTEDMQLGMMVEIVREYGDEIPGIIKSIKEKHVADNDKEKAEVIFSTVHRCKGMEYDAVQVVNDFITEEKLEEAVEKTKKEELNKAKLNEEINLLYVAITRTKSLLHIPETLIPADFPASPNINVLKIAPPQEKLPPKFQQKILAKGKAYNIVDTRGKVKEPFKPWTTKEDAELAKMLRQGQSLFSLAKHFRRTETAIKKRMQKLGLKQFNYK